MSRDKVAKSNALHESEQPLDLSIPHNDKNIIKQSLKSLIQTRRLAEGKGLLNVTFTHQEAAAHEVLFRNGTDSVGRSLKDWKTKLLK